METGSTFTRLHIGKCYHILPQEAMLTPKPIIGVEPILVLLLTLLPNLEYLHLVSEHHVTWCQSLYNIANEKPAQTLARLKSVHLGCRIDDEGADDQAYVIRDFCRLPSLKSITVHNVQEVDPPYSEEVISGILPPGLTFNITSLTLTSCAMFSKLICKLLSRFVCLETFYISPSRFTDAVNAFGMCEALKINCTTTLQSLTILREPISPHYERKPYTLIGSLSAFTRLWTLTADLALLTVESYGSGPTVSSSRWFRRICYHFGHLYYICLTSSRVHVSCWPQFLLPLLPPKEMLTSSSITGPISPLAHVPDDYTLSKMISATVTQLVLHVDEKSPVGSATESRLMTQMEGLMQNQERKLPNLNTLALKWPDGGMRMDLGLVGTGWKPTTGYSSTNR